MARILRILLLVFCLSACISALRVKLFRRKGNGPKVSGCRNRLPSCSKWAANGLCTSLFYSSWMKLACARSCGICPTPAPKGCQDKSDSCSLWATYGHCTSLQYSFWMRTNCKRSCGICSARTTVRPSTPTDFQIHSSAYGKCLTIGNRGFYRRRQSLHLVDCIVNSKKQMWRWTARGQLQSSWNRRCLAVTRVWKGYKGYPYGAAMQPCTSRRSYQHWKCISGYLKVKNHNLYLIPFVYSGISLDGGVLVRSTVTNSCLWSRYGTSKSLCAVDPTTTPLPTTPSTPLTTAPKTPPVPPTAPKTPPLPPTAPKTPPLPTPTDDLATPPVPTAPMTTKPPPPQGNKQIRCGTKGRVGGVVNGTASAAGSWPWQVGIRKCANCNITCGGTLINDEWVVTAAHCVAGWFPEDLYIVIGEVDQSKKSGHEQRFKCNKIIMHKGYGLDAPYDKDIALIRLDKYAVFNEYVRPLCMPASGTALTEKDLCTVTGFGRVAQNGLKSAKLLQANVKVVPLKTCKKSYLQLSNPRQVTSNMLCAGYKQGGTDACHGDSGGPLTCFDRGNSRFILGGIVSWGVGCARANLYGVYTHTSLFTTWVQQELVQFGY